MKYLVRPPTTYTYRAHVLGANGAPLCGSGTNLQTKRYTESDDVAGFELCRVCERKLKAIVGPTMDEWRAGCAQVCADLQATIKAAIDDDIGGELAAVADDIYEIYPNSKAVLWKDILTHLGPFLSAFVWARMRKMSQ